MKLRTVPYSNYEQDLPQSGAHILAQLRGDNIIVYQAFRAAIAEYALKNQCFGGADYSFSRMSWIKPNFLWMMYRSGWAAKEGQEYILAIEISLDNFKTIFKQAVHSSFQSGIYASPSAWEAAIKTSEVRLQWDPDHDPVGRKLERKAVQLGLRGNILKFFATDWIISIENISGFVREQGVLAKQHKWQELLVAEEKVVVLDNI